MNLSRAYIVASKLITLAGIVFLIAGTGSCGKPKKVTTVQAGTAAGGPKQLNQAAPPSGTVTPKAAEKVLMPRPEYRYERFGKVDPFEPVLKEGGTERKVPLSPLERFDVHELKLKAIIYDPKNPVALLEDPEGETYIVKRGMRVGRMGGVITRISRDKVYILEKYEDIFGNTRTNEVVLSIEEEE